MKYKYLLSISIIISLCIWGYFSFQRKIIFIEHPTLEINSVFHYQEYIYKIKKIMEQNNDTSTRYIIILLRNLPYSLFNTISKP